MLTPADISPDFSRQRADIWVIDANEFTGCGEFLRGFLLPDELERHARFACRQNAATWLTARAGLRFLLGRYLDRRARSLKIETEGNGKPFVSNPYGVCFNISHSGNIVVIVVTDRPVGIDVEQLERRVDSAAVLRRFFSPLEQQSHADCLSSDPKRTFFRGWTRKEAVLKATGEGIAGLAHNEISFAPGLPHAMLTYHGSIEAAGTWFFYEFEPAPGYIAALACQSPSLQIKENHLHSNMLTI
ncbi:MAG: hypothetical protein CVV42_09065 [Candidatus Riflebacteria bacterium HGW-Riflebacteria-2]|nr:MAG: hypothetical protein CVV42_09065 [Candidatus Riflebacteria bacterium HGW-Riflebacteria-2]